MPLRLSRAELADILGPSEGFMLAWQFHGEIYVLEEESDPMII